MRLEIGSGRFPTEGYFHLDLNPNVPELDRCGPAFPLDWLADESVAEILAIDVLEHISYRCTHYALRDWARVLAPGGLLTVQVPEAHEIITRFFSEPWLLIDRAKECGEDFDAWDSMQFLLLGGHADGISVLGNDDWRMNAHNALFSAGSLGQAVVRTGLDILSFEITDHPNVICRARKP